MFATTLEHVFGFELSPFSTQVAHSFDQMYNLLALLFWCIRFSLLWSKKWKQADKVLQTRLCINIINKTSTATQSLSACFHFFKNDHVSMIAKLNIPSFLHVQLCKKL